MRLFLIILCASCFLCSKGKNEEKKELPKDSLGVIDKLEDSLKNVKTTDVEAVVKKEEVEKIK